MHLNQKMLTIEHLEKGSAICKKLLTILNETGLYICVSAQFRYTRSLPIYGLAVRIRLIEEYFCYERYIALRAAKYLDLG